MRINALVTQVPLEFQQRPTHDVRVTAHMQAGVIARSLDPVDIRDIQEQHLAPTLDYESLRWLAVAAVCSARSYPWRDSRHDEARVVKWLQQVIERPRLEGAQRILIVGRHKDDGRRQIAAQQLEYVKAPAFGHLHVEKHQVRLRFSDCLDRLQAGPAFGDGSNVRITAQEYRQVASAPMIRRQPPEPVWERIACRGAPFTPP